MTQEQHPDRNGQAAQVERIKRLWPTLPASARTLLVNIAEELADPDEADKDGAR